MRGAELAEPRDATREDILAEAGHLQTYGIDGIIACMPARQGLIDCESLPVRQSWNTLE